MVFLVTVPLIHASPETSLALAGNQQRLQTWWISLFAMPGCAHQQGGGGGEKKGDPRANIKNISHPRSIDTWSARGVVSLAERIQSRG